MKSRISSCKRTAFRKDLSRFWPVWVSYLLCLVICQLMVLDDDPGYWYASNMGELISVMGVITCGYALVTAQVLFGDLFNTRMCGGLHSLPLRREHWFLVHIRAGFLFSLLPTALITLVSEGLMLRYSMVTDSWQIPLYWFAAGNLQYVFFFGLAVFSAMCAGSRFAMAAVYGILNFFSILVYVLVDQLYTPLLRGVTTMSGPFELLCPSWQLVSSKFINLDRMETGRVITQASGIEEREYTAWFELVPDGWIYAGILAVIGIALLLVAKQMYKKRHLECAGDFLAVSWLEPVFQLVFTVLSAAVFHGMFLLFFGINNDYIYILPAIGLTVGWFAGRMLVERTTRVFRLKNIAGFAVLTAVLAGSLYVTYLDPLGIETWIPGAGEVKNATVRMNYRGGYTTEDPAQIADLTRLHQLALEQEVFVHPDYDDLYYNPVNTDNNAVQIILQYENEYGWLSQRNYYILAEGEGAELLKKYTSRLDVLFANVDIRDAADLRREMADTQRIVLGSIEIPDAFITEEFCGSLADAIAADCEAGSLVQSGAFHTDPVMQIQNTEEEQYFVTLEIQDEKTWLYFYIYADCENIWELLDSSGALEAVRQQQAKYSLYG